MRTLSSAASSVPDTKVDEKSSTVGKLERLARFYDSAFTFPGTKVRIGWDSIFGLIPCVGDLVGVAPLVYYVKVAREYDLGNVVIFRLVANQAVDFVLGSVPIVGDLFDWAFKANLKNARLLIEKIDPDRDRSTV